MRKLIVLLALGAAPLSAISPAMAEPTPAPDTTITVEGGNRMVCRRVTRTASRMGTGARVCRTQAQWRNDVAHSSSATSENDNIGDASDALEVLGEKVSTNGGAGMNTGGAGPY